MSKKVYALDTNIVSYFLKNINNIDNRISDVLSNGDSIVITPICLYEIRRGLMAVSAFKKLSIFDELCHNFSVGIIDIGTLKIAADIYVQLRKIGIVVEDADILTAAFCMNNDYVLVTHNLKHFERIDNLNVIDWIM